MQRGSIERYRNGRKRFTFVELLTMVAILVVLVAIAFPNVDQLINGGKNAEKATELVNIQIAVKAMIAESTTGKLTANYPSVNDLSTVTAPGVSGDLNTFYTRLTNGITARYGPYFITQDGKVSRP